MAKKGQKKGKTAVEKDKPTSAEVAPKAIGKKDKAEELKKIEETQNDVNKGETKGAGEPAPAKKGRQPKTKVNASKAGGSKRKADDGQGNDEQLPKRSRRAGVMYASAGPKADAECDDSEDPAEEIKPVKTTNKFLIPRLSFHRLIRECAENVGATDFRFTTHSLVALQECVEAIGIGMFEDSYLEALYAKRITLLCKDIMVFARRIRGANY